jgi:hypothetical protein
MEEPSVVEIRCGEDWSKEVVIAVGSLRHADSIVSSVRHCCRGVLHLGRESIEMVDQGLTLVLYNQVTLRLAIEIIR